jgi:hypothetical protein
MLVGLVLRVIKVMSSHFRFTPILINLAICVPVCVQGNCTLPNLCTLVLEISFFYHFVFILVVRQDIPVLPVHYVSINYIHSGQKINSFYSSVLFPDMCQWILFITWCLHVRDLIETYSRRYSYSF